MPWLNNGDNKLKIIYKYEKIFCNHFNFILRDPFNYSISSIAIIYINSVRVLDN